MAGVNRGMSAAIVSSSRPVTLLGGGELEPEDLELALRHAPGLVAADGGAAAALRAGRMPDAVIGDMDSLSPEARARIPAERLHRIAEQETTDFDKCLRSVAAPALICVGFTGARRDHELAALSALVRHPRRRALVLSPRDVIFHAGRTLALDLPAGSRLSLFPMAAIRGRSSGLEWPLAALDLAPWGRIGTSNRVTGPVRLSFDGDGMLAILPRAALERVLQSWGVA